MPAPSNQPFTFPSGCSALPCTESPSRSLNFQLPSQSCQVSDGFWSVPGFKDALRSRTHLWPSSSNAAKRVSFQPPGLGLMRHLS